MGNGKAQAYAPSTITNFFAVHREGRNGDFSHSGATGGGYIVSRGVLTTATVERTSEAGPIQVTVDDDPNYDARTTRNAVQLMLAETRPGAVKVSLRQQMQVPVGHGFGASAAAALSAVYAVAAALGLDLPKASLASFAHRAEIIQQTGLGTVSAMYDAVGAGAVTVAGAPGVAKFLNVKVESDIRVVTGSLAPYAKSEVLGSAASVARVNRFGTEALARVVADPTLDNLAASGEWFSNELGLTRPDVRALVGTAKSAGASYASQNMIGHAMHALVPVERASTVAAALESSPLNPRVDVFELGRRKAGVVSSDQWG